MKYFQKCFLLWVAISCLLLVPNPVLAEEIRSFDADITVKSTGVIDVTETISYDFGEENRHGIFRKIPTTKINQEGKKFRLDISAGSVTDQTGATYPWTQSRESGSLELKIGDPDTVVTGVHEYRITYSVSGALTYFSDHDELYWNITGNDWEVPIEHVAVRVQLENPIDPSVISGECFSGRYGENTNGCFVQKISSGFTATHAKTLVAGEGVTVVFGFPMGLVSVIEPTPVVSLFDNPLFLVFLFVVFVVWYLILPGVIVYRWYKYGRDPKSIVGVTSAWFDPPKARNLRKLTPAETGAIYDETVDFSDIAATIVDLARRGYLTIVEEKNGDFVLSKGKKNDSQDRRESFETLLYDGIFSTGDIVNLKTADLVGVVEKSKKKLYETVVADGYFNKNPDTTKNIYTALSVVALVTGNILLATAAAIFGRGMVTRTQEGADARAVAQSLRNFLVSQEHQFAFQGDKKLLFEKLLPYAVAFGVEKQWAKRFEDLKLAQPSWYHSSSGSSWNSVIFANHLSSSMRSVRGAATPTSSSSGFSSGSGGFSGGGGGGGGGGSW